MFSSKEKKHQNPIVTYTGSLKPQPNSTLVSECQKQFLGAVLHMPPPTHKVSALPI